MRFLLSCFYRIKNNFRLQNISWKVIIFFDKISYFFLVLQKSFLSRKCESLYSGFSRLSKFVVGVRATSYLLVVFKNSNLNPLTVGLKDLTYVFEGDIVIVFGSNIFVHFHIVFYQNYQEILRNLLCQFYYILL